VRKIKKSTGFAIACVLGRAGALHGYGVKTLPGVVRVGKVLENAGENIQSAAAALDRAAP
jgi:hypothetical protein